MTKTYRFQVTGPTPKGTRAVISRHMTLEAAQKALRLVRVNADQFRIEEVV